MVDEGYDFTLIAEKLNRTALATRGKYERLQKIRNITNDTTAGRMRTTNTRESEA